MDKENLTAVYKFEAEIDENGKVNFPVEKLKELREKGFKNVNIVFSGSSEASPVERNIDIELFTKIKDLQGLPETVVYDFLISKGKLKNSNLEKRI